MREKKRRNQSGFRLKLILVFIVIAAAAAAGVKLAGRKKAMEVRKGIAFVQKQEKISLTGVDNKIKQAEDDREAKDAARIMEKVDKGEISVWSLFGDSFLLGDSRAEPISYYEFLPEDRVYAVKGANLRKAKDGLEAAKSAAPSNLIFTYGLNDADGNWDSASAFSKAYGEVIDEYRKALPDAAVYLCSVAPVTEAAVVKEPKLSGLSDYNEAIETLCKEKNAIYIDCSSLYRDHRDLYEPDGMHFKKDMYPYWAKIIANEVLKSDQAQTSGNN